MSEAIKNLKRVIQKAKYKTRKRVGNKWVYTYDEPKGKEAKGKEGVKSKLIPPKPGIYKHPDRYTVQVINSKVRNGKNYANMRFVDNPDYGKSTFGMEGIHLQNFLDGFTLQKKSKKTITKATDAQENLSSLLKADSKSKKSVEVATKHPNKLGAGASERKKLKKPGDKVAAVMKEFKNGTLHSGSGEIVTDVKQAKAIAISEAGLSKAIQFFSNLLKAKYKSKKRVGNKWVYVYDEPKDGKSKSKQEDKEDFKYKGARIRYNPSWKEWQISGHPEFGSSDGFGTRNEAIDAVDRAGAVVPEKKENQPDRAKQQKAAQQLFSKNFGTKLDADQAAKKFEEQYGSPKDVEMAPNGYWKVVDKKPSK